MKRNIMKIILLALTLAIPQIFVGCSDLNSIKENSKTDFNVSGGENINNSDLSFAVFGDIHDNTDNFKDAVNDLYNINSNMDALILNGDVVDQGIDKQYDSMKDALKKNSKKLPQTLIKNIGNHEFYNYESGGNTQEDIDNYISKYLDFSGNEKVYHDIWIKDYHFISLGSDETTTGADISSTQASLSEAQLSWFKETLKENYTPGKPIFVFLHQPIHTDFFGMDWYGVRQGNELKSILKEYPEIIIFSSHDHKEFADDSITENLPFTMASTGAVGYTLVKDNDSENGRRRESSYNNALYVEVNDTKVTLKQRDVKNKEWKTIKEINNN